MPAFFQGQLTHAYSAPKVLPIEALLSDDFELWLVHAPLVETSPGCRFEACESEEACTCEEERDTPEEET